MTDALVASLGMYDFPWTAAANDALWRVIAAHLRAAGVEAPTVLSREPPLGELWRDSKLIFGQTCGYPYVTALRDTVALVATPVYSFPGCEGASHRSFIVARKKDARGALAEFRGAMAAVNTLDSNSGMNLFRAAIAPLAEGRRFFRETIVTGSHEASLAAVAAGDADLAAIDCVSFALLAEGRPDLARSVRLIAQTMLSAALPFVMSAGLAKSRLSAVRAALFAALADPLLAAPRETLGLVGAIVPGEGDYERVAQIEAQAVNANYPTLA